MVRKEIREGKLALLAVLGVPLLLANCTTSPETVFNWNVNDQFSRPASSRIAAAPEDSAYSQSASYVATPREKPEAMALPAPRYAVEVRSAEPVSGSASFAWPVSGRVISTFGSNDNGQRNDGINIATPLGTPIHAAADGSVSYAGNELKGYGNLVLLRHDNGYVTAYAHADRLTVNRGDRVTKGQIIGYAGQTGDVSTSQLHFEIRNGVTPVNPQSLLMASR